MSSYVGNNTNDLIQAYAYGYAQMANHYSMALQYL